MVTKTQYPTVHWIETCGALLMSNWNTGRRFAASCHIN